MSNYSPEHDKWLNFQLICKPEQSGKTFIMIAQIVRGLTPSIQGKEIVNIILCDNNLLLAKQTSSRVQSDVKRGVKIAVALKKAFSHWKAAYGIAAAEVPEKNLAKYVDDEGVVYIELSSHGRTEFHDVGAVFTAIIGKEKARNIICCTNRKRMDDIATLIEEINDCPDRKNKYQFNIWLDEADKFIKFIDTTLIPTVDKHDNVKCKLITATPQPLFKKYKSMDVFPIENTTSEKYHGWDDNHIRIIDHDGDCAEFAEHVLSKVIGKIKPGTKLFIPGKRNKKSHDEIKKLCVKRGIAVICVNGDGLKLTLPYTRESIVFAKDDDLNSMIMKIYTDHKLARFPLAITGYICIGRGITIMSENFMIDYAILSHYSDKNEASQLAGRTKGNIKGYENYKPPTVFTTEDFDSIAREWEGKSRILAEMAFEKEQNGEAPVITARELYPTKVDTDKDHRVFDTQEEALEFAKETLDLSLFKRKTSEAPKELQVDGKNPTSVELFKRMWGINAKSPVRMSPTLDHKWCVYWRPSLLK